ncbi:MAG: glycosyl hydrolase family 17 protein [Anaerolineae bacterium]
MKTSFAPSNRWLRAVRLGVAIALGTLLLAAGVWALRETASVHAGPATLYVDWATGTDTTEGDRRPFDGDSDGSAVVDMGADEVVLPYDPGKMPAFRPDLDWDKDVDVIDIMLLVRAWSAERGNPEYRQYYDLHHDGRIDIEDLRRVTLHWREMFDLGPHFPLGYSPYRPGQAPGGPAPSPLEISEDMEIIGQETKLIRTYGACAEELAAIPGIADGHDIHVYQGVELTSAPSANAAEMGCFAMLVTQHENIVAGVIGGEVLLFGHLSESELIDYLDQAKEIGNVPVTTGDSWGVWCNSSQTSAQCQGRMSLASAVDFILAHVHPYWEKVPIEHEAAHVVAAYITLRVTYPHRAVIIGETGWPTCGDPFGNAVPGLENQRQFIEELWRWSNLYDIPVQYFEAFDEDWKVVNEGEVGRCWGLYHADRTPKHDNLDWSIPTPEPSPTTPSVRIEHPRDISTTVTKPNCAVPIFGRAYNAESDWHVKVEVFTDQWYVQDKWYPDGLAPIVDDQWSMPEVFLGGQDGFNNHSIRATLVDETNVEVVSDEVAGIVRTTPCSP